MKKRLIGIIFLVLIFSCRVNKDEINSMNKYPIQNFVWSVRLLEGFKNDTIQVIIGDKTYFLGNSITSGGNGCTDVFFSFEKKQSYVFVAQNGSNLLASDSLKNLENNRISFILEVNGHSITVDEAIDSTRFFGFSLNENYSLTGWRSSTPIGCQ